MDFSSFVTSLGTSFLIFVVLMLLFTWLSRNPGNTLVYYPNRILKDLEPWEGGSRTRNPFAWIQEALSSSEQDLIAVSGLDTAVYFVFLTTVLGILVLSGLVPLPVLLPVSATNHPPKATNISSGSFSDLNKLSMGNIEVNKIWEELEGHRKKLARAEAINAESKSTGKPEGARPTNKTGFLGLFGGKVDSIEYYNEKINEVLPKLESEQKVTRRDKQLDAALVLFMNRLAAASAAQSLHAQLVDTWTTMDAPERRQLIWTNLKIKFFQSTAICPVYYCDLDHIVLQDSNWVYFCFHNTGQFEETSPIFKPSCGRESNQDSVGSLPPADCTHCLFGYVIQVTFVSLEG